MSYTGDGGSGNAVLGVGNNTIPSSLLDLLMTDGIQPGSPPGYQTCKEIYVSHPLGGKMAESPVKLAQSQERDIQISGSPEEELKEVFKKEWEALNADNLIRNCQTLARVYGISSIVVGDDGDTETPIQLKDIANTNIYFNVLDPLNTAGSLILNQDPNSSAFMKPTALHVAGKSYHASRSVIAMNEQPVYIEWTSSAFGFVGRSVYQRALYPLKSFIQSMITDNAVTEKAALLVAKMKSPGSIIDQQARSWFGFKRQTIQGSKTGNVVGIGIDESIESVDLKNLKDAAEFARNNILKNIATAADMPASLINQETMAEGFGEGSEDAKNIARYIDGLRIEMNPLYKFFDAIVQHRAWTEDFYKSMQRKYPEKYSGVEYITAFTEWKNSFKATWPNLLKQPDSEIQKGEQDILKAASDVYAVLAPTLDPINRAAAAAWLADIVNDRKELFNAQMNIDEELLAEYIPPAPEMPKDSQEIPE